MTALYQFKDQNMSITLTEKAAQRVRTFLENRGKGIGLRLGVKTSGCSGLGSSTITALGLNHLSQLIIDTSSFLCDVPIQHVADSIPTVVPVIDNDWQDVAVLIDLV